MIINGKSYTAHSGNTFFNIDTDPRQPLPSLGNNKRRKNHCKLEMKGVFDKETFVDLKMQGNTISEIALLMGIEQSDLLVARKACGLWVGKGRTKKFTPETIEKMVTMHKQGYYLREIAEAINSTASTVRSKLNKQGIYTGRKPNKEVKP